MRRLAGDRLDPPHVGRGGGLDRDLERADDRGAAHVRAAAQLARPAAVADLDHPHHVAVLLAEQRHRAEAAGLVERRGERPDGMVGDDLPVDRVLDVAQLLVGQRRAVGEVEAQLVGPDVRAGLAHVGPEPLAQRRVQQVGRGVVALGQPARGVDARDHALALVQLALDRLEHERLVVADAHDVEHARRAAAVLALDHPAVVDLAAAGRVERRLHELGQHTTVLGRQRGDRGRLLDRLVAGEGGRLAVLGEGRDPLALDVARPAARARARAAALLLHQLLEALLVDAEALLGRQLEREVEREAVRVVEQERLVGADALLARVPRARDHVVEQPHALLERAVERLLLAGEPHLDRFPLLVQLRICGPHQLAHDLRVARQEPGLDPDPPPLDDRAPHQPPQHVAALLVRGHDAVGDQEAHPARVVGEDPQCAIGLERLLVAAAAELLAERDQRLELVGLEHRLLVLQDRREPVEAEPRVDVLGRERGERPHRAPGRTA